MRFGQQHVVSKWTQSFATISALFIGGALTLALFLVLPMLENIGRQESKNDLKLSTVDAVEQPPPPTVAEEKKPEPPPEEAAPPELTEQAAPLDLAQLELALNPGLGEGAVGDFAVKLSTGEGPGGMKSSSEDIFSMAELDQAPRVMFQPAPQYPPELKKKKIQGTVYVLFIVDQEGRVREPKIQKTDNTAFDVPAMNAVKKWRFEPGKVGGKAVQFRMRVPLTFAL
jgi:periplasmic protein TonB